LVWQGLTNREIARTVGSTEAGGEELLRDSFDTLGVWTRLELSNLGLPSWRLGGQGVGAVAGDSAFGSLAPPAGCRMEWEKAKGCKVLR